MHPSTHLRNELAQALERIAALESRTEPPPNPNAPRLVMGVLRDASGRVIVPDRAAAERASEARNLARAEADEARIEARSDGLRHGQFRDPFGMIRSSTGQMAVAVNADDRATQLAMAGWGEAERQARDRDGRSESIAAIQAEARDLKAQREITLTARAEADWQRQVREGDEAILQAMEAEDNAFLKRKAAGLVGEAEQIARDDYFQAMTEGEEAARDALQAWRALRDAATAREGN